MKDIINKITKESILVPYLMGPHGIGKSSFVRAWAAERGLSCFTLNLSACEATDLTGLPQVRDGRVIFTRPKFFDAEVLFLDEINRVVDPAVKAALLSLFVDRSINGHEFRGIIIAAGNVGENYEVSDLDPALEDRLIKIHFSPDLSFLPSQFKTFVETNNLLGRFSLRRLTEASKFLDDLDIMSLILDPVTSRQWSDFSRPKFQLKDLLEGQIPEGLDRQVMLTELAKYRGEVSNKLTPFLEGLSMEETVSFLNQIKETGNFRLLSQIKTLLGPDTRDLWLKVALTVGG